jgi:hypothetical protein
MEIIIMEEAAIFIPVLYILAEMLKKVTFIPNAAIPFIITLAGIGLCACLLGFNLQAVVQGILIAGTEVLGYQMVKQFQKKV